MTEENKIPVIDENQLLVSDYKDIFLRSDKGARIKANLDKTFGRNKNPYVEGSFDRTAQKCGELAVLLHIEKMMTEPDAPRQTETISEPKGEKP